jgi:hypothetical protein
MTNTDTIPTLRRVTVTNVSDRFPGCSSVHPEWDGVDRPQGTGWIVKHSIAERLVEAIWTGVVLQDPEVCTDVNGKTFVHARSRVSAKYANADLRRLGF